MDTIKCECQMNVWIVFYKNNIECIFSSYEKAFEYVTSQVSVCKDDLFEIQKWEIE